MDKILSPELIAIAPVYVAGALLLAFALIVRRSKLAVVKSARAHFPAIFFGAFTVFAASFGIYYFSLCLRELFAASTTAWRYFLAAELALLCAWHFWNWTRISLAIRRGTVKNEQVKIKRG